LGKILRLKGRVQKFWNARKDTVDTSKRRNGRSETNYEQQKVWEARDEG